MAAELQGLATLPPRRTDDGQLAVASVHEAHRLRFNRDDLAFAQAHLAVPPYQAMRINDRIAVFVEVFDAAGDMIRQSEMEHPVQAWDLGLPVLFQMPRADISSTRARSMALYYQLHYATGIAHTTSPIQTFSIEPAAADRLEALAIVGHEGDVLDPTLTVDGLTFRIAPYPSLAAGDTLIVTAQAVDTGACEVIAAGQWDASAVDSGVLEVSVAGDWLMEYLNRTLSLSYQVGAPGKGLAGTPRRLDIRAPLVLPAPVVEGAGGSTADEGEYKAQSTADGVRVRVPSKAVYPADAQVQMHWEGFPGMGSTIVTGHNNAPAPMFIVPPSVVAPNIGKKVKVFYRVTPGIGAAQDSAVYTLNVLPAPAHVYPTPVCVEATNGVLHVDRLSNDYASVRVTPWLLIAQGQQVTMSANGQLRTGVFAYIDFLEDRPVTSSTAPVTGFLDKSWLRGLAHNSQLEFTISVTADEGATAITFPRLYLVISNPTARKGAPTLHPSR